MKIDNKAIEQIVKKATELRHRLHMYPELSGEETQTKKILMDFLVANTDLEVKDRGLWFYAYYRGLENTAVADYEDGTSVKAPIAFRADFDAIKGTDEPSLAYGSRNEGVAHNCGHDGHSSSLCAFAMHLDRFGADRDVYLIFQHGEETGIGGESASSLITEKNIREIYAVHNYPGAPFGSLNTRAGTVGFASVGMEISFEGVTTHASTPELGVNPANAISELVLSVDDLAKAVDAMATVVQVNVGSRAFGVSPGQGKLLITVRAEIESNMDKLVEAIRSEVEVMSHKHNLKYTMNYDDRFPETVNSKDAVDKVKSIFGETEAGDGAEATEAALMKFIEMKESLRTSEDFGYYLKNCSGAMIWLGAGEDWPPLHDSSFDYNDRLIGVTCDVFRRLME